MLRSERLKRILRISWSSHTILTMMPVDSSNSLLRRRSLGLSRNRSSPMLEGVRDDPLQRVRRRLVLNWIRSRWIQIGVLTSGMRLYTARLRRTEFWSKNDTKRILEYQETNAVEQKVPYLMKRELIGADSILLVAWIFPLSLLMGLWKYYATLKISKRKSSKVFVDRKSVV